MNSATLMLPDCVSVLLVNWCLVNLPVSFMCERSFLFPHVKAGCLEGFVNINEGVCLEEEN